MTADVSELRTLAADLGKISDGASKRAAAVVKRGAVNIETQMQTDFAGSKHFRQIGPTINFDMVPTRTAIEAQIGPDKRRRAARLANIAYFGGANGGGGTVDVTNGLRQETPKFLEQMEKVLSRDL